MLVDRNQIQPTLIAALPQPALQIGSLTSTASERPFMPDDHSEVVPLLPIPNRTVKRLSADDSAGSRVKVGHGT